MLPERRTPDRLIEDFDVPLCLLILDNGDRPELLSAKQRRLIPDSNWLEIVVTTRCDPADIGAASRSLATVEVGPLLEGEGVELLRSFMPGEEFPSIEEEEEAKVRHEQQHRDRQRRVADLDPGRALGREACALSPAEVETDAIRQERRVAAWRLRHARH